MIVDNKSKYKFNDDFNFLNSRKINWKEVANT